MIGFVCLGQPTLTKPVARPRASPHTDQNIYKGSAAAVWARKPRRIAAMRSLDKDVPKTISSVLSTHDFRGRKDLIEKVFTEDVKFWHLFFQTVNRKELFGVYQMWGK